MPIPEQALRRMVEEYEAFARLLSDPNLKKALDNLVDDERALNAAFEQPAKYMKEQGVEIPSDMEVELFTSTRRKWAVTFCRWTDRDDGLSERCCIGYRGGDWPPGQGGGHHTCSALPTN